MAKTDMYVMTDNGNVFGAVWDYLVITETIIAYAASSFSVLVI